MAKLDLPKIVRIENAKIRFRNLSGKEGRYNPAGQRNFSVLLDPDIAQELEAQGWNVKYLEPRDPEDKPQAHLRISVSYTNIPPKIVLVTSNNQTTLKESEIGIIDFAEIANVDLSFRPYVWEVGSKTGVKAYLKTMYVTIVEDEFEQKYKNVPDSSIRAIDDGEAPFDL